MANQCINCSAELFAGQQFCRACGTATASLSATEMPTQILYPNSPPAGAASSAPTATAPLPGGHTGEVFPRHATSYPSVHVPPAPPAQRAPRRSSAKIWLVLALALLMIGAGCVATVLWAIKSSRTMIVRKIGAPRRIDAPPVPPAAPAVDETGAVVSGDKTVVTKTYALAPGASVSLKNISGSITVEGWDEERAEVKIIKHGGSAEERRAVGIREESNAMHLSLERPLVGGGDIEVEYEVKLPRTLKAIEISSMHSDVKLSNVEGAISVELKQGDISLTDVSGGFNLKTIQGDTTVEVDELRGDAASKIESIAGDIELHFSGAANADLKAETLTGEIGVDDGLGLKVEKRMMGEQATGRLGDGKHQVSIKAIKGDIKITK